MLRPKSTPRARPRQIAQDLAALGCPVPPPAPVFALDAGPRGDMPGAAWVLAGSALGNRAIARQVQRIGGSALFDCAAHRSGGLTVSEFEPHARNDFADHVAMILPVIARLEALGDPQALCATAAGLGAAAVLRKSYGKGETERRLGD